MLHLHRRIYQSTLKKLIKVDAKHRAYNLPLYRIRAKFIITRAHHRFWVAYVLHDRTSDCILVDWAYLASLNPHYRICPWSVIVARREVFTLPFRLFIDIACVKRRVKQLARDPKRIWVLFPALSLRGL